MLNFWEGLEEDKQLVEVQRSKLGPYVEIGCPNCGRYRVMVGKDGKNRCEKCHWCVEDDNYDYSFLSWSLGHIS